MIKDAQGRNWKMRFIQYTQGWIWKAQLPYGTAQRRGASCRREKRR